MSQRTYECIICKKKAPSAKGFKIFPEDRDIFKAWCNFIDPSGTTKFLPSNRICHAHFGKDDFQKSGILKPGKVPSILDPVSVALYWGIFK